MRKYFFWLYNIFYFPVTSKECTGVMIFSTNLYLWISFDHLSVCFYDISKTNKKKNAKIHPTVIWIDFGHSWNIWDGGYFIGCRLPTIMYISIIYELRRKFFEQELFVMSFFIIFVVFFYTWFPRNGLHWRNLMKSIKFEFSQFQYRE